MRRPQLYHILIRENQVSNSQKLLELEVKPAKTPNPTRTLTLKNLPSYVSFPAKPVQLLKTLQCQPAFEFLPVSLCFFLNIFFPLLFQNQIFSHITPSAGLDSGLLAVTCETVVYLPASSY